MVTVDVGRAHHAPYRGIVEWILTSARASDTGRRRRRGDRVHGASEDARAIDRGARGGDRPTDWSVAVTVTARRGFVLLGAGDVGGVSRDRSGDASWMV